MAKLQVPVSRWRRFFRWFGRHKVTAVFTIILLALALYLGGSWVMLQVQIHSERERFVGIQSEVSRIRDGLKEIGATKMSSYCYYESSPVEFTKGNRICVVRLDISQTGIDKADAVKSTSAVREVAGKDNYLTTEVPQDSYSIAQDGFNDFGIGCSFSSLYYDQNVIASARAQVAPKIGPASLIEIICSESAKAEYFPVTSD